MRYSLSEFVLAFIFNLNETMLSSFTHDTSKSLRFFAFFTIIVNFNFTLCENVMKNYSMELSKSSARRVERYLVYPTPGTFVPTKVQLIAGLGLPMEVDVSMIIGYVMKFNYALPYNASYLTHPNALRYDRSIDPRSGTDKRREENEYTNEESKENNRGSTSRWDIYRVIESTLDGFKVSGKGCLLRIICQLAEVPFEDNRAGLFAELINVLLTPSTTQEKYEVSSDQEYHSAEAAGRDNPGNCENLFPECDRDLLEYFTETNIIKKVT